MTRFSAFGKAYAVEAGSWEQYRGLIVLPQLILWPGVTLLAGVILGLPAFLVASRWLKPI